MKIDFTDLKKIDIDGDLFKRMSKAVDKAIAEGSSKKLGRIFSYELREEYRRCIKSVYKAY